jgi:hypothetical protein
VSEPKIPRRAVAVAVVTPLAVVIEHALGTLQSAWLGPPVGHAALHLVWPVLAAGLAWWLVPKAWSSAAAAAMVGILLAAVGAIPWGFLPLVALIGASLGLAATGIATVLPESVDRVWQRSRGKAIAWTVLAILAFVQVSRLSVFMADRDSTWGSTFPPVEFTITHMCMASYVHAADLTRQDDPNLYDPIHYPNFELVEASDIETSVVGLQSYLDDSFHYPPPFLLLPRTWLALTNDYLVMRSVWFALQLLSFVAFAVLLARWIGGSTGAWALWMLPLVTATMPALFNFQFGQIHLFTIWTAMAGMLAFDVRRPALGGFLLAGGIASKLFPGVLVLYLLFKRRWRDVAWTAVFGAGFTGLSLAVTGLTPFQQFFGFTLPRLISGEAFSFVTDPLVITTNLSVPGSVWKLDLLGIEGGDALLGPASTLYTVFLLIVTGFASRLDLGRAGRAQIWLALLILASLRSALVPIYGVAPVLWLMTLQLDSVDTRKGLVAFGLSWAFVSSVPPAPDPVVTIALYTVAQIAMLYWVLRPMARRQR